MATGSHWATIINGGPIVRLIGNVLYIQAENNKFVFSKGKQLIE